MSFYAPHPELFSLEKKPTFSAGDLIYLCGYTPPEKNIRLITNFPFSHVAIMISPEVLTEVDVGGKYRDGVRVLTLEEKLNSWRKRSDTSVVVGVHSRKTYSANWNKLPSVTSKYLKHDADATKIRWLFPLDSNSAFRDSIFCSEYIAMLLIDLGIVLFHHPTWYSPKSLLSLQLWDDPKYFLI